MLIRRRLPIGMRLVFGSLCAMNDTEIDCGQVYNLAGLHTSIAHALYSTAISKACRKNNLSVDA